MAGLSEFLSEGMEMKVVVNDLRQQLLLQINLIREN